MTLGQLNLDHRLYFVRENFENVVLEGPDIFDYLHRITSQHFLDARLGEIRRGAFLSAQGKVLSLFHAQIGDHRIDLFIEPSCVQIVLDILEQKHFGEDLTYRRCREVLAIEAYGLKSSQDMELHEEKSWTQGLYFSKRARLLTCRATNSGSPKPHALKDWEQISRSQREQVKVLCGIPLDRRDLTEANIILEANLDEFVHPNKGCYPGQEVVERIRTYGNVAKRLVVVELSPDFTKFAVPQIAGLSIYQDEKVVGEMRSVIDFGEFTRGWAMIQRRAIESDSSFYVIGQQGESNALVDVKVNLQVLNL